jgi:hypothetical protein
LDGQVPGDNLSASTNRHHNILEPPIGEITWQQQLFLMASSYWPFVFSLLLTGD